MQKGKMVLNMQSRGITVVEAITPGRNVQKCQQHVAVLQSLAGHDAQQHLQTSGHVPFRQDPLRKHTHGTSPATLGK